MAFSNLHAVVIDERTLVIPLVVHVGVDVLVDLVVLASVRASLLVTDET